MNTISWLIYFSGIVSGLKFLLGISALLSLVGSAGAYIFSNDIPRFQDDTPQEERALAYKSRANAKRWVLRYLVITAVLAFACVAVPGERAIYLIAASEIGETVVTSPDAAQILGDLKEILKKRLREELAD